MSGFAPKDVSRGASLAFMGFVKGVAGAQAFAGGGGGGGGAPTAQQAYGGGGGGDWGGAAEPTGNAEIDSFVAQWGLDGAAQKALLAVEPEFQQRVMSGFSPKDISRGASIPFMGFIKSVTGGGGATTGAQALGGGAPTARQAFGGGSAQATGDAAIDAFVAQWSLDASAQNALTNLDPEMRARIMSGFAPKDTSRGASVAFMGFVKSVTGGSRVASGNCGAPTAQQAFSQSAPAQPTGDATIDAFVAQWALDAKAQETLCKLDAEAQQRVMAGFAPKDISRGASAAFMGFARKFGQPRPGPY